MAAVTKLAPFKIPPRPPCVGLARAADDVTVASLKRLGPTHYPPPPCRLGPVLVLSLTPRTPELDDATRVAGGMGNIVGAVMPKVRETCCGTDICVFFSTCFVPRGGKSQPSFPVVTIPDASRSRTTILVLRYTMLRLPSGRLLSSSLPKPLGFLISP